MAKVHILALTSDGTVDWQVASPASVDVNIVEIDFDKLRDPAIFDDDVHAIWERVHAMPKSIPWRRSTLDQLREIIDAKRSG